MAGNRRPVSTCSLLNVGADRQVHLMVLPPGDSENPLGLGEQWCILHLAGDAHDTPFSTRDDASRPRYAITTGREAAAYRYAHPSASRRCQARSVQRVTDRADRGPRNVQAARPQGDLPTSR